MIKHSKIPIFLIVLFLLAMQTSCSVINPPQDALRQLFNAIDKKDYDTAIQFCTGNMHEGFFLGQTLENWCDSDYEGDITIKILNVDSPQQGIAYITFELHLFSDEGMREKKLLANLVHRKGKWLVDDVNEF